MTCTCTVTEYLDHGIITSQVDPDPDCTDAIHNETSQQ